MQTRTVDDCTLLRRYLQLLDGAGRLVRISRPVKTRHELGAIVWRLRGQPVIFENVVGHTLPVASNLCSDRDLLAHMIGVPPDGFIDYFLDAVDNPLPCAAASGAALYDVVVDRDIHLAEMLPIPHDYDRQQSPVINGGVMIARDAETGILNTSFHILEVISKDEFVVHVVSPHFAKIYGQYQRNGEALPVALALGLDPLAWLACTLSIPHPPSELDVAGAVRRQPIELIRCKTVDLEVPADAEIVLEGEVLPNRRETMGPEPRPRGFYGPPTSGPVLKIRCVARRKDALFHHLVSSSPDHLNLLAVSKEATLLPFLRGRYPFILRLSCYGAMCVVAVRKTSHDRIRPLLEDILRYTTVDRGSFSKFAVVVDDDVDVYDRADVERALYTRVRPERVVLLSGIRGSKGDPELVNGTVQKIGVDATVPLGSEGQFHRPHVPSARELDLREYLPPELLPRLI